MISIVKTILVVFLFSILCATSQGVDDAGVLAPWFPRNLPEGMQFSGAVGSRFRIRTMVQDAIVSPGSAFDFEVDIQATGSVVSPPGELDFEVIFAEISAFKVEVLTGLTQVESKRWRYFCRLWPSKEGKAVIPEIPFTYINPDIPWLNKQLMLEFSDPIEVEVLRRKVFAVSLRGPEVVFDVDNLRNSPSLNSVKGFGLIEFIWIFFTPPFVGIVIWSLAKHRSNMKLLNAKGRAFWVLENLTELQNKNASLHADGVFELMQEYFRSSLGFSGVVTNAEIGDGLFAKFLNPNETQQFSKFFSDVEKIKFYPDLAENESDIIGHAIAWIRILEVRR